MSPGNARDTLEALYRAAVAAAEPGAAVTRALDGWEPRGPVVIIALGKAAPAMARAAVRRLRGVRDGIVIAPSCDEPVDRLRCVTGDHPFPGQASREAAEQLARLAAGIRDHHHVLVLLSGGASSLAGAPIAGVTGEDYHRLVAHLLGSGLDIHGVNAVRKAFSRWGGGRLARALVPAPVRALAVSDVPGNRPRSIGSGPLTADPGAASAALRFLDREDLPSELTARLREALTAEPLPVGLPDIPVEIIADNRTALEGARREAQSRALSVDIGPPLEGEAGRAGETIGLEARALSPGVIRLWGGETTVSLGAAHGVGGRSQELALAAACALDGARGPVVLAAGTDGRDGPTDAAGAVVDGTTWGRIVAGGRHPAADLARHDSHPALAVAGALFRPGPTGTNVMDLVIATG